MHRQTMRATPLRAGRAMRASPARSNMVVRQAATATGYSTETKVLHMQFRHNLDCYDPHHF